jgi:hypothetical protein
MLMMRKAKKRTLQLNAQLAQTLTEKGVEATADETTTDLVGKVAEISTGSEDSYYDIFWDNYQQKGQRQIYRNAFTDVGWNDNTYKPKHDIIPTDCTSIYNLSQITDLRSIHEINNIKFDTSNANHFAGMFSGCTNLISIPTLDFSKVLRSAGTNIFRNCERLESIEIQNVPILEPHANYNIWHQSFLFCTSLKEIKITGFISANFSVKQSPLNVESAKNVINCLVNYSGTENEFLWSVSFSTSTLELLEAEGNTSPNGGTWAEYIGSLGWNM